MKKKANKKLKILSVALLLIGAAIAGHLYEISDDEPFVSYIAPAATPTCTPRTVEEAEEKININSAGKEELALIPGIGEAFAERIIAYRTENGEFKQIMDIMLVPGIGKKKFEKMEGYICVE